MKALTTFLSILFFTLFISSDSMEKRKTVFDGAWEVVTMNGEQLGHRGVFMVEAPYAFYTEFDVEEKKFVGSLGGGIEVMANRIMFTNEFNTWMPDEIGRTYQMTGMLKANMVTFTWPVGDSRVEMVAQRIDDGVSDLAGSWRITDRMRDGEMQAMRQGPRKTIKMITGTRFQWAAFNPDTQQFSGTGGGTAEVKDGKYIEHIEFFSRNAERVGASLSFDYQVNGNKWDHSGKSSSGNPIREIWTKQ